MPDGSKFTFRISATAAFGPWPDVAEQAARMWGDVGVRAEPDIAERSLMNARNNANENMGYVWNSGGTTDMFARSQDAVPLGSAGWAHLERSGELGPRGRIVHQVLVRLDHRVVR